MKQRKENQERQTASSWEVSRKLWDKTREFEFIWCQTFENNNNVLMTKMFKSCLIKTMNQNLLTVNHINT